MTDRIRTLELSAQAEKTVRIAVAEHRYTDAETVLIPLVEGAAPTSLTYARLVYLGGVYAMANDPMSTAVALKKAQAIAPLQPAVRFSLAMAYVQMGRRDWAANELRTLAAMAPRDALYPYWQGRLQFDAQQYDAAIALFQAALELDPGMARAHDNLGLCYFQQNRNELAVAQFEQAITLEQGSAHASAWPWLNLGITQAVVNQPERAEASFRRALALDPRLAQAHFHLGNLLVNKGDLPGAVTEFTAAATDEPNFAEPHVALARLYRRMGDAARSDAELGTYKRLREAPAVPLQQAR